MGSNAKAALIALLAFAIFSSHDVIVKMLGTSYSTFQILFFSVLFGFPFLTAMQIGEKHAVDLRPRHPGWIFIRTISVVITGTAAFYAFSVLPLSQVYAILFSVPLIITILSIPMLGEKVGIHRLGAVAVGLLGVLIVLQPGAVEFTYGHLAALGAAFFSAFSSIIVRKIGTGERPLVLLLYPMLTNLAIMALLMPPVYRPMQLDDLSLNALMAVLGLVATYLIIKAYQTGEAVIVAPMQYSQIIWAAVFGALYFNETLSTSTMIGAAVVIASGLYILIREARAGRSEHTPVLRTRTRLETGTAPRVGPLLRRE